MSRFLWQISPSAHNIDPSPLPFYRTTHKLWFAFLFIMELLIPLYFLIGALLLFTLQVNGQKISVHRINGADIHSRPNVIARGLMILNGLACSIVWRAKKKSAACSCVLVLRFQISSHGTDYCPWLRHAYAPSSWCLGKQACHWQKKKYNNSWLCNWLFHAKVAFFAV